MTSWADSFVAAAAESLVAQAVPADVEPMTAYMRGQFPFLGVKAAGQRVAERAGVAASGAPAEVADVRAAVDELWRRPEREYRYVGCLLANRFAPKAPPGFVPDIGRWIVTDPWWDTCDTLARRGVGTVVRRHSELRDLMDEWLRGEDVWLTRTALLHMGAWGTDIDVDWVFGACLAHAGHGDFFIRKAIGWVLRDVASQHPDAVRDFVEGPGAVLSGLSRREATRHIGGAARR